MIPLMDLKTSGMNQSLRLEPDDDLTRLAPYHLYASRLYLFVSLELKGKQPTRVRRGISERRYHGKHAADPSHIDSAASKPSASGINPRPGIRFNIAKWRLQHTTKKSPRWGKRRVPGYDRGRITRNSCGERRETTQWRDSGKQGMALDRSAQTLSFARLCPTCFVHT